MYQAHSQTSREAYCKLTNEQRQIDEVYAIVKQSGNDGLTDSQISMIMGIPSSTVSARINTLRRQGLVKRSNNTRRVNGRFSTINYAMDTTMGQFAQDAQQKRDRIKGLVKELLLGKNDDGSLNISALDVKRLERLIK